jgi:uncharacterized membrane protein YccF (DUF307 family)
MPTADPAPTAGKRPAAKRPAASEIAVLESTDLVPTQPAAPTAETLPATVPSAPVVQQPSYPATTPAQVNVQVTAPAAPQIVVQVKQRGLFARALWYVFVGWWLSGILMFVAGVCIASVVLLPAGLALVNRLPQVMTLRPRSTVVNAAMLADGSMQYTVGSAEQRSMLVRAVYFFLVGWWAGMFVMFAAWFLSVLIVTMPLGLMLLNRVPAAVTLRRN